MLECRARVKRLGCNGEFKGVDGKRENVGDLRDRKKGAGVGWLSLFLSCQRGGWKRSL